MPRTNVKICLTDRDRNVFSILVQVTEALRKSGHADLSAQFQKEAIRGDYGHALRMAREYVAVA